MPTTKHKIVGTVRWQRASGGRIQLLDGWEAQNIVTVYIPQLDGVPTYGGRFNGRVRWHKGTVAQLKGFFQEVEDKGLKHLVKFWDGSFVPRMVRGSTRTPSNHTFGTAFDINADWNGLGVIPPAVGRPGSVRLLVPIAEKWGFFWGGNYRNRKDGMHFEIARVLNAPNIAAILVEARDEPRGYGLVIGDRDVKDETGKPVVMPVENGSALAPVRAFLAPIGLDATYRAATKTVVIHGKDGAVGAGVWGEMKEPVRVIGGIGHLPVRDLAEFLNLRLEVDNAARKITVTR